MFFIQYNVINMYFDSAQQQSRFYIFLHRTHVKYDNLLKDN